MSGQAKAPQDTWQAPDDVVAGLFREHGLSLVRLAVLLTGDRATAEDVVQDAFLRFQRALPRLRDPDKALAYLRASVVNGCRSVGHRGGAADVPDRGRDRGVAAGGAQRDHGALVARVTVPPGYPGGNSRTYITDVATGNGRDYLVAEYASPCRSWIYQFSLNSAGQPSALTPFAALPTVPSELYGLTVSGDGQMVGFTTTACMGAKAQPNYVGITNIRTGHTTRWTTPSGNSVDAVSLTADGKQLCYSLQGEGPPSLVRVIPTSAVPGSAAGLGRTVARPQAAQAGHWISFSAISADGSKVYFSDVPEATLINGQIRVTDLATGRSRVVYAPAGEPGLITSDPGVRHLLLQVGEEAPQPGRLVRLNLATGTTTDLPSRRFVLPAVLYW